MAWINFVLTALLLYFISLEYPQFLDDRNEFLKGFFDEDFLSILGFMVSLTVASAAGIYLKLREISGGNEFINTRRALRRSAVSLLYMFSLAILLCIVKPLVSSGWISVANIFGIMILYFNISVMLDITRVGLSMPFGVR